MSMIRTVGFWGCLALSCLAEEGARSLYDSEVYSQIPLRDLTDANRAQFLSDVRAAQVGTVLLSFCDAYDEPPVRQAMFGKLAREIAWFRTNGVSTIVWINGFGYGNVRKGYGGKLLEKSQRLVAFASDRPSGAICPTDPVMRQLLREQVRDVAKAGARFILMDDDYVQSVRPGAGCACPAHLKRVSTRMGRTVSRDDIRKAFTGGPNPLRTAYLDVSGEIVLELARELRREVDGVDPTVGMGLCASYTHHDVEGASLSQLMEAFGGTAHKLGRISGAPYWRDSSHFSGATLAGTLEFVRMQSAWYRNSGFPMLDENDPHPRKVSVVPAWRVELYDKAVVADGGLRRHKYMLCYGPDRSEPGYLEAHLADLTDDAKLKAIFAGTVPAGVRVLYPRTSLREAWLPTPYMGDSALMGVFSHPIAAQFLVRNGIPCRHEGEGPAIAFGTGALEIGEKEMARGVIVDRSAADLLKKRGVDVSRPCFHVLDLDLYTLRLDQYVQNTHRNELLQTLCRFANGTNAISITASTSDVYSVLHRNPKDGSFALLLENIGEQAAEVRINLPGPAKVLQALRGEFKPDSQGLLLERLPAHGYAAVRFGVRSEEMK